MFLLVATLYYLQERSRLSKEAALDTQLKYIECMKLGMGECTQSDTPAAPDMTETYQQILSVLALLLLLFIPISLYLSFFSVRPVRRASAMIDDFIAHIVHDINTPISTILLNSRSLLKRPADPDARLHRILASGRQLQGMQHDLLALADEKTEIERQEVDLTQITEEITAEFRLRHSDQPFETSLKHLIVHANRLDLQRILQNLLSNAVKYNRDNHPIRLYTQGCQLVIEDQGTGIKHPQKVFQKHYREDYSVQGNGIGLASVMAMLHRNHIDISVSSRLGHGTTIRLDLSALCIKETP